MSVNEKMTNIANEIRNLSNTNEAMGLDSMASNLNTANSEVNTQVDLILQIANSLEGKATSSAAIAEHNASTSAHPDIREEISQISFKKVDKTHITQEAGESESLVMSQKAVTDLVAEAIGTGGGGSTQYETVDSADEMTDTSRQYVLKETGTIWTYGEIVVEKEPENVFVKSTAKINARIGSDGMDASTTNGSKGCFCTDYIELTNWANLSEYIVRINFELQSITADANGIYFYDESKNYLNGQGIIKQSATSTPVEITIGNGVSSLDIKQWGTYATAKYVRFRFYIKASGTALVTSDLDNVEITFDADGGTTIESRWYDTGMTPSASGGSGGGNYVDLLVKVNENKTDIAEINKRVTELETGSETVTVPTFWQSAVDEVITKIKALQVGRNCITFPFFSDNHQRNGCAGMLIAHIMKECNIPYCFFGGDSISNGYIDSEETMIAQDKAFDTIMQYIPNGRFCRAVGNHDGFWNVSSATGDEYHYTREQIYDLFLREESIAQNKHFGDDGTYYYIDDIASKTRFIIMNTNGGSVDSTQITWLENTALSLNESGWAVVFISHQPISNHYHAGISNAAEVRAIVSNYINSASANKADIVGWFSGHIHRDRIYTGVAVNTSNDSVGEAMGFTQVTITSDHTSIAYDDATKHTVAADDQSHAIDFITINKNTRKVNLTRLGIGNDRSYTY